MNTMEQMAEALAWIADPCSICTGAEYKRIARTALAAYRQQAAEPAGSDTARIDWLGRQCLEDVSMTLVVDAPHDGAYFVSGDNGSGYGKTFRAAIDAAMRGEKADG